MSQHTPRPWRLEQVGWEGQYIYGKDKRVPGVDRFIASVSLQFDGAEANARLIAAAPELLEACKQVIAHRAKDYLDNTIKPYDGLVLAITRATVGEQP